MKETRKNFFEILQYAVGREHLIQCRKVFDGNGLTVWFPNGYGASILCHSDTYGGSDGLVEIAVVVPKENNFCYHTPVYDTPVTDDVLGYLDSEMAIEILREIESLPPRD